MKPNEGLRFGSAHGQYPKDIHRTFFPAFLELDEPNSEQP